MRVPDQMGGNGRNLLFWGLVTGHWLTMVTQPLLESTLGKFGPSNVGCDSGTLR
jgi:hypothetical protein